MVPFVTCSKRPATISAGLVITHSPVYKTERETGQQTDTLQASFSRSVAQRERQEKQTESNIAKGGG